MSRNPQYLTELAAICSHKWNDKQLKVIRETALGNFKTQKAVAEHLDIDPAYISRINKHPDFWPDVLRVADHYYGAADIQIDRAVIQAAKGYTYKKPLYKGGELSRDDKGKIEYVEHTAPPDMAAAKLWYERRRKLVKDMRVGNIGDEVLRMEVETQDAADMKELANDGDADNED